MLRDKTNSIMKNLILGIDGIISPTIAKVKCSAEENPCLMILISKIKKRKYKKSTRESSSMSKRPKKKNTNALINVPDII